MLYGGSIPPGHFQGHDVTIGDVYEAIGAHATGRMSDEDFAELESVASPGAGACGGQFTANTMAMAFEVLGISPMAQNLVPAQDATKAEVAYEAGKLAVDVLERGLRPSEIITTRRAGERDRRRRLLGRLDQCASCTCSPSRARSASSSTSTTSTAISERTPLLCDLKPGGQLRRRRPLQGRRRPGHAPAPPGGRPPQRGHDHGHRPDDRRARPRGNRDRGPARRPPARRAAEADRRPGHPARQPGARRLRRSSSRATRSCHHSGPRASSTARRRPSPRSRTAASRPATSWSSATRARPAAPACARCSR